MSLTLYYIRVRVVALGSIMYAPSAYPQTNISSFHRKAFAFGRGVRIDRKLDLLVD